MLPPAKETSGILPANERRVRDKILPKVNFARSSRMNLYMCGAYIALTVPFINTPLQRTGANLEIGVFPA